MRTEPFLLLELHDLRRRKIKLRPVDAGLCEVHEPQPCYGNLLVFDRQLGILPPVVRCGDHDPALKWILARFR